eukprot:COSAG04_NODE_2248_length_4454_cov_4.098278_3_plen_188_part_00
MADSDRRCHQAARDGILAHVEAAARARQEHAEAKRETAAAKDDMLQDLAQAAQERQAQAEAKRETAAAKDDMLQGLEQAALERQALAEAKREIAAAAQDGKTPRYCRHLGCILPRVPAIMNIVAGRDSCADCGGGACEGGAGGGQATDGDGEAADAPGGSAVVAQPHPCAQQRSARGSGLGLDCCRV